MDREMCIKNPNSKYFGQTKCHVCRREYKWVENDNAELIVENISLEGNNTFIDFKLIASCPMCGHKCIYKVSADGKEFR